METATAVARRFPKLVMSRYAFAPRSRYFRSSSAHALCQRYVIDHCFCVRCLPSGTLAFQSGFLRLFSPYPPWPRAEMRYLYIGEQQTSVLAYMSAPVRRRKMGARPRATGRERPPDLDLLLLRVFEISNC